MRRQLMCSLICVVVLLAVRAGAADGGFAVQDKAGDHADVLLDGKIVARYMYGFEKSTKERLTETFKPYLHIFDAEGKAPITKGPGGLFPHHRGIFIGWNKISFNGKSYDRWHMPDGQIIHQKFAESKADATSCTLTAINNWNDAAAKPFLEEQRTMVFRKAAAPGRITVDCTFKITAIAGDVVLDGDPEHAGIHYRPANELTTTETLYYYPVEKPAPHKDLDYPWVGMTYTLAGKQYSVVEMSHPANPKGTKWSAYRDYGRFGAFPKAPINKGETLTLKYRFLIVDGEMPAADAVQKVCNEFTGASEATPKVTKLISEQPKPAAPKPAVPAK